MKFSVSQQAGQAVVKCDGKLDENITSDLGAAQLQSLGNLIVFDCENISHINSIGISRWVHFLQAFSQGRTITFRNCSVSYYSYACLFPKLRSLGQIESFFATLVCDSCGRMEDQKFAATDFKKSAAAFAKVCGKCKGSMSFEQDVADLLGGIA